MKLNFKHQVLFFLLILLTTSIFAKSEKALIKEVIKEKTTNEICDNFIDNQIEIFCKGKSEKVQASIKAVFNPNRIQMLQKCVNNYDKEIVSCGTKSKDVKEFMKCDPKKQITMLKFRKKVSIEEATEFLAKPLATDSEKRKLCKKATANILKFIRQKTKLPMIPDSKKFNETVDACEKNDPMKKVTCIANAKSYEELTKCKEIKK